MKDESELQNQNLILLYTSVATGVHVLHMCTCIYLKKSYISLISRLSSLHEYVMYV